MAAYQCDACGQAGGAGKDRPTLSLCSGCRLVKYCSKECQASSWKSHKAACKASKKEARLHVGEMWEASKVGDVKELRRLLKLYPSAIHLSDGPATMLQMYGNRGGSTPLEIASACGQYDCVELLLANGARLDQGDGMFGQLPIHRAAECGHIDIVRLLLEKGANPCAPDGMGQEPLHFAAEHGQAKMVRFLLDNGARPSLMVRYRGRTPKMWAEMGGHSECAALL